MHMVSRPYLASRRSSSQAASRGCRAPVAPTGWPREMPEPLTLRRSHVGLGELPLAQHGEHLGGERLVELDQVHVGQRQPGAGERLSRWPAPGRCPSARGSTPGDRPRHEASQRAQAQLARHTRGSSRCTIAAPSFWPLALPAVTVESGSGRDRTGRSAARDSAVASARGVLVAVDDRLAAGATVTVTGTISSRERSRRAAARIARRCDSSGELVLLLAADAVLAAQVLGGLEHAAGARGGCGPRRWTGARVQDVAHGGAAAGRPSGCRSRRTRALLMLSAPPAMTTVVGAGLHAHRGVDDGLQARAAAPVDLDAGDGHGQARVERDDPADRRRLAVGTSSARG